MGTITITSKEIDSFVEEWGQEPDEIKNNLEEIYDYEIEANDEFIMSTGNYFFSEPFGVWITIDNDSSSHKVYSYLRALQNGCKRDIEYYKITK